MISQTTTVTVNKPAAELFKFVGTDYFTNHPKWDSRVVDCKVETPGPVRAGTRGKETRKQGGRDTVYDFQVTEFQPDSTIAFKAEGGPTTVSFRYGVHPVNESQSELSIDFNMQMGGFMRIVEFFIGGSVRKEFEEIDASIKRNAEAA